MQCTIECTKGVQKQKMFVWTRRCSWGPEGVDGDQMVSLYDKKISLDDNEWCLEDQIVSLEDRMCP